MAIDCGWKTAFFRILAVLVNDCLLAGISGCSPISPEADRSMLLSYWKSNWKY